MRPSYGINASAVPYSDKLPVYIRITDIAEGGQFAPDPVVSVCSDLTENYYLEEGDIVFARTGASVGKSYLYRPSDGPLVYAGFLIRVRPDQKQLLSAFLAAYVTTGRYRQWVRVMSMRSGQPGINGVEYAELPIPLPPIKEQRAITTVLSDVDALLEELDRLIAKKRDIKKATMQQLLTGQTRLPGFEGEWQKKLLGAVIDLLTGYPFPSEKYFDSGIRLLRGSNIKRGVTDWSEGLVQHWPEVTQNLQQYLLREGDIVIAMDGSLVGRSFARLSKDDLPALLLQRVARIRSETVSMSYLKEWICSEFFTKHCDVHKTVTAIPHISPGDIRSFTIFIPPSSEEQAAIASFLSNMDAEIKTLEDRRTKTAALKQAMMQELLTGRIRLV